MWCRVTFWERCQCGAGFRVTDREGRKKGKKRWLRMIVSLLELIYEKRRPTERILEGFNSGCESFWENLKLNIIINVQKWKINKVLDRQVDLKEKKKSWKWIIVLSNINNKMSGQKFFLQKPFRWMAPWPANTTTAAPSLNWNANSSHGEIFACLDVVFIITLAQNWVSGAATFARCLVTNHFSERGLYGVIDTKGSHTREGRRHPSLAPN